MASTLDLRFSPARAEGFLLGAEPAFPFAQVDDGLVVVALSRHVVDALAAGADVALNHAPGSLLLRARRSAACGRQRKYARSNDGPHPAFLAEDRQR